MQLFNPWTWLLVKRLLVMVLYVLALTLIDLLQDGCLGSEPLVLCLPIMLLMWKVLL